MSNRIRARNKKNNALERKIMKTFITAIVSLAFASSGFADNHSSSSEDTNQQALAVETSICTFNDGKDISDMNKAISSFKSLEILLFQKLKGSCSKVNPACIEPYAYQKNQI